MATTRSKATAACLICMLLAPVGLRAEINFVTGGIAGIDNGTLANGDGTNDARIEVSGLTLELVKQARNLAGTVLPNGSTVSAGQQIYFVLYVDNTTLYPAKDIRITDLIDEAQFTYVDDSLEETAVASGSDDTAIWNGTWLARSDGTGDDAASAQDTGGGSESDRITIGAVPAQANQPVEIPGSSLLAFRFLVTVD